MSLNEQKKTRQSQKKRKEIRLITLKKSTTREMNLTKSLVNTVIWITGLSGSGKTTMAGQLREKLIELDIPTVWLDGDQLREALGSDDWSKGEHERQKRLELAFKYARLARLFGSQGLTVIASTISMFKEIYEWNRDNQHKYFEVFIDTPYAELRKRDSKNIYSRFERGELENVAGLDFKVDTPTQPDFLVGKEYGSEPVEKTVNELLRRIRLKDYEK